MCKGFSSPFQLSTKEHKRVRRKNNPHRWYLYQMSFHFINKKKHWKSIEKKWFDQKLMKFSLFWDLHNLKMCYVSYKFKLVPNTKQFVLLCLKTIIILYYETTINYINNQLLCKTLFKQPIIIIIISNKLFNK